MRKIYIIRWVGLAFLVLWGLQGLKAQQEAQFTQFMYNQLYINPGYAGARNSTSLLALYRNQWLGFEGSPESKLISFNTPLLNNRIGLGVTINNHTQGITDAVDASLAYAYNLQINEGTSLRFGIQGSIHHFSTDFSDPSVFIRDPNDPSIRENETATKTTGNFGMGIYLSIKQMYFGLSVPNFYPSEITFNEIGNVLKVAKQSPHYYFSAGMLLQANENFAVKPAVLLKYVKNAPSDVDANLSFIFNRLLTVGASYRFGGDGTAGENGSSGGLGSGDSIDLLAMYQVNKLGIGVAYDFGLSELSKQTSGSFEILLRFDFLKERDDIANPRFFF